MSNIGKKVYKDFGTFLSETDIDDLSQTVVPTNSTSSSGTVFVYDINSSEKTRTIWGSSSIAKEELYEETLTDLIIGIKLLLSKEEEIERRLNTLEKEKEDYLVYKFKEVSNKEAKEMIVTYLKGLKRKTKEISIFEISQELRLPADQVETILEELEEEGGVKFL